MQKRAAGKATLSQCSILSVFKGLIFKRSAIHVADQHFAFSDMVGC